MKRPRRSDPVQRVRLRLETQGWPRLQMSLLVALAGAAGFVANWGLLHLGVGAMALRYPLAVLLAWGAFLALLWVWLRTRDDAEADDLDLVPDAIGGGGDDISAAVDIGTSDVLDGLGATDEIALPLIAIAFVVTLLFAAAWIVSGAPTLFAELIVDSALSASLYHRMRRGDARHWLDTAWRRTRGPFLLAAGLLAILGFTVQALHPGVHTLGQAFAAARAG